MDFGRSDPDSSEISLYLPTGTNDADIIKGGSERDDTSTGLSSIEPVQEYERQPYSVPGKNFVARLWKYV